MKTRIIIGLLAFAIIGCRDDSSGGLDPSREGMDASPVDAAAERDGGTDAGQDAGGRDAELDERDGAPPDAVAPCSDVDCSDLDTECMVGVCAGTGDCAAVPRAASTACGDPSASECDDADACDGAGACLTNVATAGTACGDPLATECDGADSCDGAGACLSNHSSSGAPCGEGTDTECTDPDTCDGSGSCAANHVASGIACGEGTDTECTDPDTCDGSGSCAANHVLVGTLCGSGVDDQCDNSDSCNASGACVPNNEPDGTSCTTCATGEPCLGCSAGLCTDLPECVPTFIDVTTASGFPPSTGSLGAVWADFDDDGDLDAVIRQTGLYINDGSGVFTEQAASRGLSDLGAAPGYPTSIGDFDGDGRIDLFVGGDTRSPSTMPNRLYRNTGGSFVDVAAAAGLQLGDNTSRVGLFFDHDRDGDVDLLYSNEFGAYGMFRNDRSPTFAFGNDGSRFNTHLQGDSAQFADFDADGDYDLFIATGSTGTGNRLFVFNGTSWVEEAASRGVLGNPADSARWGDASWVDLDTDGDLDLYVVHAFGDDLHYENDGDGTFTQRIASSTGLGDGGNLFFAQMFADYDLDGDLDAYMGGAGLFRNDAGAFTNITASVGLASTAAVGAWGDANGDGRLDLLTSTTTGSRLYQSSVGSTPCRENGAVRARVVTDLDGNATDATTSDDRDALGARVVVDLDGNGNFSSGGYAGPERTVTYLVGAAQSSIYAQSQLPLIIGIGHQPTVDLRVFFVDGSVVTIDDVTAGSAIVVRDPA